MFVRFCVFVIVLLCVLGPFGSHDGVLLFVVFSSKSICEQDEGIADYIPYSDIRHTSDTVCTE